jgi:hypothetical protein
VLQVERMEIEEDGNQLSPENNVLLLLLFFFFFFLLFAFFPKCEIFPLFLSVACFFD